MSGNTQAPSDRTRLRRAHERGHYDADAIHAVLDAQPLCHVGYVLDGAPQVTPTLQWREGDHVYWHGSSASRFLRAAIANPVCLTVDLVGRHGDGPVRFSSLGQLPLVHGVRHGRDRR
jgi:nitroimidazol reductase NimA-like FMN-containing flavoprotein (pyridoxamine 5'-phosphate oxidase superfamily)